MSVCSTRAHRKLCIQQPYVLGHLNREHSPWLPLSTEQTIKCILWPDLGPQTTGSAGPVCHSAACHFREFKSRPHPLVNIVPTPKHVVSLTKECRQLKSLSYSLTWVGNQARNTIQLFLISGTHTPTLSSELKQSPFTEVDHNSCHLPKNITSRHIEKPRLSLLMKNPLPKQTCKV